jgi:hypothetical protein
MSIFTRTKQKVTSVLSLAAKVLSVGLGTSTSILRLIRDVLNIGAHGLTATSLIKVAQT